MLAVVSIISNYTLVHGIIVGVIEAQLYPKSTKEEVNDFC